MPADPDDVAPLRDADDHYALRPPRPQHAMRRAARIAFAVAAVAVIAGGVYLAHVIGQSPSVDKLREAQAARPSVLLSADGQPLATFRLKQQEPVKLDQVAPDVVNALIATEDQRFHEHRGIDIRRTVASAWHTLTGDTQGGSTLTQQLARNLFPQEIGRSRTMDRKLKEMVTALRIERAFSKNEILQAYLNTAPFLYNVVGIEMAARTYFDKSAAELDTLESATLVGMLKGTNYYNPVRHPERAQKRRNLVLSQMVRHGMLADADYRAMSRQPLALQFKRLEEERGPAPHFTAHVRKWLIEWADEHDVNLYTDGLVIESTIDSRLQKAATLALQRQAQALQQVADVEWARPALAVSGSPEAYAAQHRKIEPFRHFWQTRRALVVDFVRESAAYRQLRERGTGEADAVTQLMADTAFMQRLRDDKTRLEAAFAAMDPATGEVKAWVGSRDFERDQFDHVAKALRQPGSTFKPLVYGAALEAGIGPDRMYVDEAVEVVLGNGKVWRPTDMSGSTGESLSMRDGLALSKNTITAQVGLEVGMPAVVRLAQACGIRESPLDPVPSLALGTSAVTLLEMLDVYATIAAIGERHEPVLVRRIRDRQGGVLAEFAASAERALSRESARDLIDMMRGVVSRGTGTAVKSRYGITADVAGKTGTTQDNTDGWFFLMHPQLVAGAWVGFNDQRVTMRSDHWGQGGHNAIHIVGDFFRDTLKARLVDPKAKFPPPYRPTPPPEPPIEPLPGPSLAPVPPAQEEAWSPPPPRSSQIVIDRDAQGNLLIGDRPGVEALRNDDKVREQPLR